MYGEDGCKNPDRFKFLLAADGRLVPADPVGVHYINTRKNLLKKKFDVEGEVLASLDEDLLNKNYNNFVDDETETSETIKEDNNDNNDNGTGGINNNPELNECSPSNSKGTSYYCKCGDVMRGKIINCITMNSVKKKFSYYDKYSWWKTVYYHEKSYTFQFPINNDLVAMERYPISGKGGFYIFLRTVPAGTNVLDMAPRPEDFIRLTRLSNYQYSEDDGGSYGLLLIKSNIDDLPELYTKYNDDLLGFYEMYDEEKSKFLDTKIHNYYDRLNNFYKEYETLVGKFFEVYNNDTKSLPHVCQGKDDLYWYCYDFNNGQKKYYTFRN